jgi:cytochrome c2
MKNDTPYHLDNLTPSAFCADEQAERVEPDSQESLFFFVSHPGTAIEKDTMPFSAIVNVQQRANLMAYLRTVQGSPVE